MLAVPPYSDPEEERRKELLRLAAGNLGEVPQNPMAVQPDGNGSVGGPSLPSAPSPLAMPPYSRGTQMGEGFVPSAMEDVPNTVGAPPPLSGYIPTNYQGKERQDYVTELARSGGELPDNPTATDQRGYALAKRTDKEGRFIDKDGSAVKNFFKGLGIGFLRGGIGGAIAGGIMNTARGNMDEEWAWNTLHKPQLDQAVGAENEALAQQYAADEAQRRQVAGQVDLRGKLLGQENTASIIRERERKATEPEYVMFKSNGVQYRHDKKSGTTEAVPGLPPNEMDVVANYEIEMPDGSKRTIRTTLAKKNDLEIELAKQKTQRDWDIMVRNHEREIRDMERQDKYEDESAGLKADADAAGAEYDRIAREHDAILARINAIDNQLNGTDPVTDKERYDSLTTEKRQLYTDLNTKKREASDALSAKKKAESALKNRKPPSRAKPLRNPRSSRTYTKADIERVIRQ